MTESELRQAIEQPASNLGADQLSQASGNEHKQALGLGSGGRGGFLVHIDLAGDKEEIIADPMQQYPAGDHPEHRVGGAESEQRITQDPCAHTDGQHPLHTQTYEQ